MINGPHQARQSSGVLFTSLDTSSTRSQLREGSAATRSASVTGRWFREAIPLSYRVKDPPAPWPSLKKNESAA
jgi:hypothetical protein